MTPPTSNQFPYPFLGGLVLFIATANLLAYEFHLYFFWWWLDIPMHILSGLWVGMATLAFYYRGGHRFPIIREPWALFTISIVSAVLVGMGWEMFELIIGMTTLNPHDIVDSMGDLFNDFLGGYLSAYIVYKKKYYSV